MRNRTMKNKYDGIFPALLTPMDSNENILPLEIKEMINHLDKFPFSGYYVGGSTGEGMLMTYDERKIVFSSVINSVTRSDLVLIAHVGATSTKDAIDMGLYAKALGYPVISAVAPFYYGYKNHEVKKHYQDIVNAVNLPFIIYNYPGGSNFTLDVNMVENLFEDERFVGIKHTTTDLFSLEKFRRACPDISIYNGFDEMLLAGLCMGASGGIGSTYNIMPNTILSIYNAFIEGDLETAIQLQAKANKVIDVLISCGVMNAEKYILSKQANISMGSFRRPFTPLTNEQKKVLDNLELS